MIRSEIHKLYWIHQYQQLKLCVNYYIIRLTVAGISGGFFCSLYFSILKFFSQRSENQVIYSSAPSKKHSISTNQDNDCTLGVDNSVNNCNEECDRTDVTDSVKDSDSKAKSVINGDQSRDRDISEGSSESVVVLDRNGSLDDRSPTMTISPTSESTEDTSKRSAISEYPKY